MDWEALLDPSIQEFVKIHEHDDVNQLGLKKPPDETWPYPLILDQIKARQKAALKISRWAGHHKDIIFPAADILEQASSAGTARYKAGLVKGRTFVDLAGGAGVDTCALTEYYEHGHCIEQDENTASLITHNLSLLSSVPVQVHNTSAEDFVQDMPNIDLVYIDPQRRNENRKGTFKLKECSPNIFALLPDLKDKCDHVMIKTSPMLDISQTLESLDHVKEVHVIEWQGQCREVLYIIDFSTNLDIKKIPITAVSVDDDGKVQNKFSFTKQAEKTVQIKFAQPQNFLYEPGPAFQKSGGFSMLAQKFDVVKLHPHTHLYTSEDLRLDFPGRCFEIAGILPVDPKALNFKKANVTIRNFPGDVDALKKKLKLKDGGEHYLFACTLNDEKKALILSKKIEKNNQF